VNLFLCTRFASKTQDLAYVVQDRGANVSIKFWNADESRWIGDTLRGKDVATLVPVPADFVAPEGAVEAIACPFELHVIPCDRGACAEGGHAQCGHGSEEAPNPSHAVTRKASPHLT
jgi:hypothetical protein